MKKSKYRLYEKDEKRWVQYDKESYEKMKRWRINFCARQRYNEACFCPQKKQWMCNTICATCPYRKTEIQFSKSIPGVEDLTIEDKLSDGVDIEMQCLTSMDAEIILSRLDELMPKGREIAFLYIEGWSEREISQKVGIPRTTIQSSFPRACKILREEFKEFEKIF